MYEKDMTVRLDVGPNAYEVRFVRKTAWSGMLDDMECEEDYADGVEVLLGTSLWIPIDNEHLMNRVTREDIYTALDKWLYDHPEDAPDYDGQRGDYLHDRAKET